MKSKRIFLGYPVDPKLTQSLVSFKNEILIPFSEGNKVRWVPEANYHVTQLFLGDTPLSQLPEISEKIKASIRQYAPFGIEADSYTSYLHHKPRMFWLTFNSSEIFTNIHGELARNILGKSPRGRVIPHITLARFKEGSLQHHQWPTGRKIEYRCQNLNLYESLLTPAGAVYHVLDSYRLG